MNTRVKKSVARSVLLFLACGVYSAAARRARAQSAAPPAQQAQRRNLIIFVADGLRRGSVNPQDTPAMWAIRTQGVDFPDSHSLFPTFTTANASAIATGHGVGDTGDFSNTIWTGFAKFDTHNFDQPAGTPVPFLEDDQLISDLDAHYGGNYLGTETLLALARQQGYQTAAVGKVGPTAIQDSAAIAASGRRYPATPVIVDDATNSAPGVVSNGLSIPLPADLVARLAQAKLPLAAPGRTNGYAPDSPYSNAAPQGTVRANLVQQQWFADVATQGVLPLFADDPGHHPFALVFWSRDPDGTQHNQSDGIGSLGVGINGPTSKEAVRNADHCLQQLLDWLDAHPDVKANTDLFVTSDHGFATVSRSYVARGGRVTTSESAKHFYLDATGKVQTPKGVLPNGFLAIDLAVALHMNLYDPDTLAPAGSRLPYRQVRLDFDTWEHPAAGNGLLGSQVEKLDGSDARAIVAANGGSDLIYVPEGDADLVRTIVRTLLTFDYTGGVFVDQQRFGAIPGALPLAAIGLEGTSKLPRPAIVVAFKVFYLDPSKLETAIQVSDTTYQEGQGMHGGFGRDSTVNNMAALGPDFKAKFSDDAPVSNADIAPTLARLVGISFGSGGQLRGRVMDEALRGSTDPQAATPKTLASEPENGLRTFLVYQELGGERYSDTACLIPADAKPNPASACQ